MGGKLRLNAERRWCLNWWKDGGWTIGRPMLRGIKKWESHIDMLVKAGLLEGDKWAGPGAAACRITDAGRAALRNHEASE